MQNQFPLVTFLVIAYNEETYIKQAIEGAFSQDYPNLEIIISDDASTDSTFEIAKKCVDEYRGPHTVILNRNSVNLGIREHCNDLLYNRSRGEYIVLAAGDDISVPERTKICVEFMMAHPEISSMSCLSELIDENGNTIENKSIENVSIGQNSIICLADYIQYPLFIYSGDSRVLNRKVIDCFPPLKYPDAEDIFLFVRSLYIGSVAYIRKPLVKYRQHSNSVMYRSRNSRIVSRKRKICYKNAILQLKEDLSFALYKGYITPNHSKIIEKKIKQLVYVLKPRNRTIFHRGIRFTLRKISDICIKCANHV